VDVKLIQAVIKASLANLKWLLLVACGIDRYRKLKSLQISTSGLRKRLNQPFTIGRSWEQIWGFVH
jgi:hypothetical protein